MSVPDTPLFVKTHDFLLWLIRHTQRFPKNLRHTYTLRLETLSMEFQESILMANAYRGKERSGWLQRADGKLVCLRALVADSLRFTVAGRHASQTCRPVGR